MSRLAGKNSVIFTATILLKLFVTTCQNSNNKGNFVPEANHRVVSLSFVLTGNFCVFSHAPERRRLRGKHRRKSGRDDFAFLVSISRSSRTDSRNKLVSLPHVLAESGENSGGDMYVRFPLGLEEGPKQFLYSHRAERGLSLSLILLQIYVSFSEFLSSFAFTFCLDPDDAKGMQEQRANLLEWKKGSLIRENERDLPFAACPPPGIKALLIPRVRETIIFTSTTKWPSPNVSFKRHSLARTNAWSKRGKSWWWKATKRSQEIRQKSWGLTLILSVLEPSVVLPQMREYSSERMAKEG